MPVIRLAFIITVCPMIIKHLFFMDVVCFVIGLNPGSSKSTWESKKKKKRSLLISTHSPKPSARHERCIATCTKTAYTFLWFWFRFFFFSSHTSPNVFVSHWRPTNVCVRGFAMSSWKKDPQCAGKRKLFCQEHCLFCVCVAISQTLCYPSAFVPYWQQIDILHIKFTQIHPLVRVCIG